MSRHPRCFDSKQNPAFPLFSLQVNVTFLRYGLLIFRLYHDVAVGEDGGQVVIDVLEHGPGQGYGTAAGVDGRKVQPGHRHMI